MVLGKFLFEALAFQFQFLAFLRLLLYKSEEFAILLPKEGHLMRIDYSLLFQSLTATGCRYLNYLVYAVLEKFQHAVDHIIRREIPHRCLNSHQLCAIVSHLHRFRGCFGACVTDIITLCSRWSDIIKKVHNTVLSAGHLTIMLKQRI